MAKHRNCTLCGEPIVLVPSAAERARKDVTGKPASYYLALFTAHATCTVAKRERETLELIARRNAEVLA
ncbi:MAG TPA: hypothetical protein VIU82_00265 [Bosea sp. (in: a-proteobacteria)]